MKANIVTLPGDYIGPEIIAQAVKVLEAVAAKYGHEFYFDERKLGGASIDAFGVPLTDETLAACNAADAVLMGSVGGPKWDAVEPARRPEKGLLALRKGMQVFANLRPCTIHPQRKEHNRFYVHSGSLRQSICCHRYWGTRICQAAHLHCAPVCQDQFLTSG